MLIHFWHSVLDMAKYDEAWHRQDLADEVREYEESRGMVSRWSELSDVVYTCTRGWWSGHRGLQFPLSRFKYFLGALYMIPKYTLRWLFFLRVGHVLDPRVAVHEVRNPTKSHKLREIAERNGLDPEAFERECMQRYKSWIFLK